VKEGAGEKLIQKEEHKNKSEFFAFYSKKELKEMMESSGFNIKKIKIDIKKDNWIDVFATK